MPIRQAAVAALTAVDLPEASSRAAELLAAGNANSDPSVLLRAFMQRSGGQEALASALSSLNVPSDSAKLSLRFLQTLGTPQNELTIALRKSAGLSEGPTQLTPEQMKQLIVEVAEKGDAARGERIFRRKDASCYQCHAIAGAGGFLAPDLSSIGASSPIDYIIDSILDPNKAIKDGYQGVAAVTKEGEVVSGIKVRSDAKSLVLRDATRPEIVIPADSIRQQKEIGSLMPIGMADPFTHQEFLDLVRFLSELGKPGPYGPSPAPLIRRWRIMEAPPATVLASELPPNVANDGSNWLRTYSLVSGELPPDAFRTAGAKRVGYSRSELQLSDSGKIRLLLNDATGVSLWIDGKKVEAKSDSELELPAGLHAMVFAVEFSTRGNKGLKVEVADAPGSKAHAQPISGI
jgi:putative heme-binding domain-containing protein